MPCHPACQRGFTLVELLIAIAVFAIIGLGANQVLRTVMDTSERVRSTTSHFTELNLAFSLLGRDLNQFVPRPIRDGLGDARRALVLNDDNLAIEFTRRGWPNPSGQPRSGLQRVAWVVDYEEKTLKRLFWKVLDRAEDSEPVERVLLRGVTDLRIQALLPDENDADALSLTSVTEQEALEDEDAEIIPVAVEVTLATETLGEVVRVFQLVDAHESVVAESGAGEG